MTVQLIRTIRKFEIQSVQCIRKEIKYLNLPFGLLVLHTMMLYLTYYRLLQDWRDKRMKSLGQSVEVSMQLAVLALIASTPIC